MWNQPKASTLLTAVVATGAGTAVNLGPKARGPLRWLIVAASVTTGGTVKIQGSNDNSVWFDLLSSAISATGNTTGTISEPIPRYIRGNVTVRTDGTYTVTTETLIRY